MTRLKKIILNNKKTIENIFSLSILQAVNIILPLITLPYVIRIIGKSGYGIYAMSFTLLGYFITITDFSFSIVTPRDVAINRDDKDKLNRLYSNVLSTKLSLALLSTIIFFILLLTVSKFKLYALSYLLTLPALLGNVLFATWMFQGLEDMKYITIINVTIKVIFTLAVFIFIKEASDYNYYIAFQSFGYFFGGITSIVVLRRKYNISFHLTKLHEQFKLIKRYIGMFVNIFLPNLYKSLGILLLGVFYSNAIVGTYDSIMKVVYLGLTATSILSQVYFPQIARDKNKFQPYLKISLAIGVIVLIVTILATPLIFWYLNIKEYNLIIILVLMSLSVFGINLSYTYGQNFLINHQKENLYIKATMIASILGGLLIVPAVYWGAMFGAAGVLAFSNITCGLLCIKYKKGINEQIENI